jgi:sigma-B regulation protein RsbQ
MRSAALFCIAVSAMAEYANLDGNRVYYEVAGKGEPAVVFVHGWTCDTTFWRDQRSPVAKKHRAVFLDLPGHGRSDKPEQRYDLPLFSRAVLAVMDAAKVPRAVLVGHSMGTGVIRQLYADQPDRVLGIVSVDGMVLRNPSDSLKKMVAEWNTSMRGPSGLEVRRKFIESMFTDATTPELRKHITTSMLAAPEHVAAGALHNAMASPLWNNPRPVTVPVLAVNKANKDDRYRRTHEESFSRLEYHELDKVSHFLQMEAPERFNSLLLAFLEKVGK